MPNAAAKSLRVDPRGLSRTDKADYIAGLFEAMAKKNDHMPHRCSPKENLPVGRPIVPHPPSKTAIRKKQHRGASPVPSWLKPRGLTHAQAAAYAGLAIPTFDAYRRSGQLPGPTLPGKRYDRVVLDSAMDKLSGVTTSLSPLEEWKRRRGPR